MCGRSERDGRTEGGREKEKEKERDRSQEIGRNGERERARVRETERKEAERVNVEKQSVARRREPSWRVAATNGLMNLMEAPRYRVAGEPRWRITEAKEGKKNGS